MNILSLLHVSLISYLKCADGRKRHNSSQEAGSILGIGAQSTRSSGENDNVVVSMIMN